jgi:hypothetical protein
MIIIVIIIPILNVLNRTKMSLKCQNLFHWHPQFQRSQREFRPISIIIPSGIWKRNLGKKWQIFYVTGIIICGVSKILVPTSGVSFFYIKTNKDTHIIICPAVSVFFSVIEQVHSTVNSLTMFFMLPVPYIVTRTIHCVTRTVHCVTHTIHCVTRTVHCVTRTIHCVTRTVHYVTRTIHCVTCTICYIQKPNRRSGSITVNCVDSNCICYDSS